MNIEKTTRTTGNTAHLFTQATERAANPSKYRKSVKPKWARFKLKFHYRDGNESIHFSYDWNPDYSTGVKKYRDDEQIGFSKLLLLIDKYRREDKYNDVTIYMTLNPRKDTSVPDYDLAVAYIQRGKDIKLDQRLKWTAENKVILELFATKGGNNG